MAPDTHQIHDISPGIAPSGLFWTVRIPDHWVSVDGDDLDDGTAQTPPDAAVASFDMRWMGNTAPADATDSGPNQFTMKGIMTHATMSWSASVPAQHFKFQSDAASTSHETFAELVNERNGSFFSSEDDD